LLPKFGTLSIAELSILASPSQNGHGSMTFQCCGGRGAGVTDLSFMARTLRRPLGSGQRDGLRALLAVRLLLCGLSRQIILVRSLLGQGLD
jgi:hypothetical protein